MIAQTTRLILLLISLYAFGYSLTTLVDAWQYQEQPPDIKTLMYDQVTPEQLNQMIGDAINQDRLEDAKMYLSIARQYDYPLHYQYYQEHIEKRDTDTRRLKRSVSDFAEGFVSGNGENASGIAGAVTADFTVIGDARDLYNEYQKHEAGQPVNELIVGLAGVGVGLTVVTYGSAGSTAAVKAGTSLLKMASKTGRITKAFSQVLVRSAKRVFDWDMFSTALQKSNRITDVTRAAKQSFNATAIGPLQNMVGRVNRIKDSTSVSDTLFSLKYVDDVNDLARMEKFAVKHGHQSRGLLTLLGKGAIRSVRVLQKTGQLLFSGIATLLSFMFVLLFLFRGNKKATA